MNILGIESSCDDTSVSVLTDEGVKSNIIASQSIHVKFGGVVPELASRAHQQTVSQTVKQALDEAGINIKDIQSHRVQGIITMIETSICHQIIKVYNVFLLIKFLIKTNVVLLYIYFP